MDSELMDNRARTDTTRPASHVVGWRDGNPVRADELAARIGAWKRLLGRTPGRRFALFIGDSIEFAAALFGALQAEKKVFLPSDALSATCASLSGEVDGFLGEFPPEWKPLSPDEETEKPGTGMPDISGDAELVIYTSGSTGDAQAIPKRMDQLLTEVASLERLFGRLCDGADVLATVSHQHIYGLLFKVLWPLVTGRAIHVRSLRFPEELVAAASSRDAILISSPAHLKRFPDSTAWDGATHRIRAVFSSGGPLDGQTAMETARLMGSAPLEIYGSSETGGIAWRQRRSTGDECWTPMPGVDWRTDEATGALEIRSPHLPDSTWFRMADRAAPAGGGFHLLGRMDRIVKIEEKRVSLDAIEKRLALSAFVSEARALPVDAGKGRQRIAAVIVPTGRGRQLLDEKGKLAFSRLLRDWLAPAVERVALPKRWRYPDSLPVNAQGKTTRAELLALVDATASPSTLPVPAPLLPEWRLLEQTEDQVSLELVVPPGLLYLKGHFPGAPILPGVVQVNWAMEFGRRYLALPSGFRGIRMLKFQQVIQPGVPVVLELRRDMAKSSLAFRYFSQTGQHATGQILFGEPCV